MRPYNTANCHASIGDEVERSQPTGIHMCCADQLPAGTTDCRMLSCKPEAVMRLQAVDGGCTSQAIPIHGWNNLDYECDANCNHNVSYEPLPNEGCGCTGSYNGGAGAGTAMCCSGSGSGNSRETYYQSPGRGGGQRCCSPDYKYVAEFNGPPEPCAQTSTSCYSPLPPKKLCCPYDSNAYHRPRGGTTPQCMNHYVPEIRCSSMMDNPCSGECPDTYELVRNTDAQRYKGRGPDRSHYFADDCFHGCS